MSALPLSSCPISAVDYFPTFLDIANIKYNGLLDGNSALPLLCKDSDKSYVRPIIWQLGSCYSHGTCTAIRIGDYKLIEFLATGEVEPYNLVADPKESRNIAQEEPKIAEQLLGKITSLRKKNSVPLPPNSVVE